MATHDIFVDGLSLCRTHNRSPWECLQSAEARLAIAVEALEFLASDKCECSEDGRHDGTCCRRAAREALAQMGEK